MAIEVGNGLLLTTLQNQNAIDSLSTSLKAPLSEQKQIKLSLEFVCFGENGGTMGQQHKITEINTQALRGGRNEKKNGSDTLRKATVAAVSLLLSGEFRLIPEDYYKIKGRRGFTICEAQGTPEIRSAARKLSAENPQLFTPSVLRKVGRFHERNFRILQFKRLGHALNLDGIIRLADGSLTQYSGFSEAFTIPMIAASVWEYSKSKGSLISEEAGKWIGEILNRNYSHDSFFCGEGKIVLDRIKDPVQKEPIAISSGYNWHSTQLFFFRGFLIYCNRGAGSCNSKGIQVYRIPDLDRITPEVIDALIKRHEVNFTEWNKELNIFSLIEAFGLEFVYFQGQRGQKAGNCTYVSVKSGVRALLAIRYLIEKFEGSLARISHTISSESGQDVASDLSSIAREHCQTDKARAIEDKDGVTDWPDSPRECEKCGLEKISTEAWDEAFKATREMYKGWSYFDKNIVIEDLLYDIPILDGAESKVISKEQLEETLEEIKDKISCKQGKYKSVYSRVFTAVNSRLP